MELEPLRDRLHHLVEKRFRGELNKCEGCKLCKETILLCMISIK